MTTPQKPLHTFSIISSVFDPNLEVFDDCAESVLNQSYPYWEWIIVDDFSLTSPVSKFLNKLRKRDERIKVIRRGARGGLARSLNDAIDASRNDYIAFLVPTSVLHVDALAAVNHELLVDSEFELLYTNEEVITVDGRLVVEIRRPDWSPERMLCHDYLGHFKVVKADRIREVGGFRPEFEGAHEHDLILRITDKPMKVRHIPRAFSFEIHMEASQDETQELNDQTFASTRKVLLDTCRRRDINGDVLHVGHGLFRIRRALSDTPRVSLIIPTRGTTGQIWGLEMPFIENFLASSISRTTYPNLEYVLVVDAGTDPQLLERLAAIPANIKFVEFTGRFNFSKKCNIGAIHSTGERIIFVNDDVEVITNEWVERLIALLEDETVGASGPLLLYDNGLVQSAGHFNASTGPQNFARGLSPKADFGKLGYLVVNRECTGVTGACLAMRRDTFFEIGGFSEIFAESFNDVDLCLKIILTGKRIIWTPDAELYHFELKSRSRTVDMHEAEQMWRYWGVLTRPGRRDPYVDVL